MANFGIIACTFIYYYFMTAAFHFSFAEQKDLEFIDTKKLDDEFVFGTFPKGFIWSSATAAYQVEGGWNADGKGRSVWDTLSHKVPNPIIDGSTGDVACDSYHLWEKDIQLIKNLGTKYYRMSISWSRILPNGLLSGGKNELGVSYYRNYFAGLLENGIQPMVTLYHWDLPQELQNFGGWLNSSSPSWFLDYARLAFAEFGHQVKYWITFNEPVVFIGNGYGTGNDAPQVGDCHGTCPYTVGHNVIKAHSVAWHAYDKEFRSTQQGKISLVLDSNWCEPGSSKAEDVSASERCMQFYLGWFANPIYNNGDYPEIMKTQIASRSAAQGLPTSRLPVFTPEEIKKNKGTFDFFALNHYTTRLILNVKDKRVTDQHFETDREIEFTVSSSWPQSSVTWLFFVPDGLRSTLKWIKKEYNNPPVIITENGWADNTGKLRDTARITYYKYYINSVLKAYQEGCNVIGYTAWSLLDNLEWTSGYAQKFGLHFVNFSDSSRPRTPKSSAAFYGSIVKNNGFPRDFP